ncbi:hypothetical protein ACVWXN_004218 [Bradyrhizobium sp. i1.4.4]
MSFVLVQVIAGGLLLGAVYALFSSGLTLVWGMMNIVNFAHGDFVMLGMYVAYVVYTLMGGGPILGAPLATLVLATVGVVVYFALIRDIMKGPMLAQILGTFGLALLLRYSVFWWFGANFLSMPSNIVGGTYAFAGLRIEASRLLAGVVALLVTFGLHLLLTRTSLGSKMLAVAEDQTAAQLMGIRPDTMQAIAWAIAAGGHRPCRRANRELLLHRADGRRDARHRRLRHGIPWRLRQRARRARRGPVDRRDRVALRLSDRCGLQGHRRLCPVPVLPLVPAARPDGQALMRKLQCGA